MYIMDATKFGFPREENENGEKSDFEGMSNLI